MSGIRGISHAVWALAAGTLALTACGSYDAPTGPPETPVTTATISGFAFNGYGALANQAVAMKGLYGYGFETVTDSNGRFTVAITGLAPAFMIQAGFGLFAIAADTLQNINVTPFTTMQATVLTGSDPGQYFGALSPAGVEGVPDLKRFDSLALAGAQAAVIESMKEDAGFTYEPVTMDFVTTPFKAGGTDAMSQLVTAFTNTYGGPSAFAPLLIPEGKLCKRERVYAIGATVTRAFCPALKSNLPDEADAALTVYGFTNRRQDSLQVRVRGTAFERITYTRHDETAPYVCQAGACAGLTIGAADDHGRRFLTFDRIELTQDGTGATVALKGMLQAPNEGPPRPPEIQCSEGLVRLVARWDDGQVREGCVYPGGSARGQYGGIAWLELTAFDDDGNGFQVVVRSKGAQVVSVAVQDPSSGAVSRCHDAACTGAVATEPDANLAYTVALGATPLAGIDVDGNPTGTPGVTLTTDAPIQAYAMPEDSRCYIPAADTLDLEIDGAAPTFTCVGIPDDNGRYAYDFGDGDSTYVAYCYPNRGNVTVVAKDGVVSMVYLQLSFGDSYRSADPANSGVVITGPDGNGGYTLSFDHVSLREIEAFNALGVRNATLTGTLADFQFVAVFSAAAQRVKTSLPTAKLARPRSAAATARRPKPSPHQLPKSRP